MDDLLKKNEEALQRAINEGIKISVITPRRTNDPRCDHYWLWRRGGECRSCGKSFLPGGAGVL